ncbi:Methyladenine glycosylase [Musa troglodytarum]|uniref:Methyladenine glycosylase n=1 Tax=Musa troglodytarum TaxID=320322 RepID=A0A9E7KTY7_9LILI|nr:Methyladenine glycosylase [Musa troglodytarum]
MSGAPKARSLNVDPDARPVLVPGGNKARSVATAQKPASKPPSKTESTEFAAADEKKKKKKASSTTANLPHLRSSLSAPSALRRHEMLLQSNLSLNASCSSDASTDSFCSRASTGRVGRTSIISKRQESISRTAKILAKVEKNVADDATMHPPEIVQGKRKCAWVTPNTVNNILLTVYHRVNVRRVSKSKTTAASSGSGSGKRRQWQRQAMIVVATAGEQRKSKTEVVVGSGDNDAMVSNDSDGSGNNSGGGDGSDNREQRQQRKTTTVERGSNSREKILTTESRAGLGLGKSQKGCWEADIGALVGSIEPTKSPETEPNHHTEACCYREFTFWKDLAKVGTTLIQFDLNHAMFLSTMKNGEFQSTMIKHLFREVFLDFHPVAVSKLNEKKIVVPGSTASSLLSEPKLRAVIENARQILKIIDEFGSFDRYCWSFVNYKPIVSKIRYPRQVPVKTPKADVISKDLVRRGFRIVGPMVVYSFMQAAGLTNDHLISCFRFDECIAAASSGTDEADRAKGRLDSKVEDKTSTGQEPMVGIALELSRDAADELSIS